MQAPVLGPRGAEDGLQKRQETASCRGSRGVWESRDGPAESQRTITARLSAALLPTPALPPPFTLKELELPLIDAQTCDGYYHENSGISSEIPIILDDMLCAGFESGQKDACGVSGHPWLAWQALPPPQHPWGTTPGQCRAAIYQSQFK